jgi:hypothetical protein
MGGMNMERFTHRDQNGIAWMKPLDPDCTNCDFGKQKCDEHYHALMSRLAAYEDTGRSPNEISALDHDVAMFKQSARLANELAKENSALKSERDVAVRALEMACDDMADSACPHDSTEYVCPNASTCPNVNGGREDSGIDKQCWYDYYTRQAKEDLQI